MNINAQRVKSGAAVVAALAVVGLGAYWYSASVHNPPIVTISQTGAGVPANASFGIPLATLTETAPRVPVSFGPLDAPQAGGVVNLRFDPSVDGRGREVTMMGDTLLLPVIYGRDGNMPERITLTYREGTVASVRYQGKTPGASTFTVVAVEPELAAADEEVEPELAAVDEESATVID